MAEVFGSSLMFIREDYSILCTQLNSDRGKQNILEIHGSSFYLIKTETSHHTSLKVVMFYIIKQSERKPIIFSLRHECLKWFYRSTLRKYSTR